MNKGKEEDERKYKGNLVGGRRNRDKRDLEGEERNTGIRESMTDGE